jgi:hypothetical protein
VSAGGSTRVEAELLAMFDQTAFAPFPASVSARRSSSRYLTTAIAAGLLLVFGLAVIRWAASVTHESAPPQIAKVDGPATNGSSPATPTVDIEKAAVPNVTPGHRQSIARQNRRVTHVPNKAADTANPEIATDFMPLTYGATASLQEGGRMVRVELPHSAMAALGLPVNIDRANERVKADVLLGVDGLAHAIRFVR